MYELITINKNVHYIKAPSNTGLVSDGQHAWLIDAGSSDEHAKKILGHVNTLGLKVAGLITTHSNADHIGGNSLIQERTGCRIFATQEEAALIERPELEPAFLWGAAPPAELKNRFLLAKPSKVTDVIEPPCVIENTGMAVEPLPGHFINMIGIRAMGDVFFIADSVMSCKVMEKYHIGFLYDVGKQMETLDMLQNSQANLYIPAHADPTDDIRALVQANRVKIEEICQRVLELCLEPITFETMLFGLFRRYELVMEYNQYVLVGSTLKAYITFLKGKGLIESIIAPDAIYYKRI